MKKTTLLSQLKARIDTKRSIIMHQGGYKKFVSFLYDAYGSTAGLSKSNISKLYARLLDKNSIPTAEEIDLFKSKVKQFENAVDAFVRRFGEEANSFLDTKWYLYFFHKDDNLNPMVMLARTVLTIDESGMVRLRNLLDEKSKDYTGRFELINGALMILNLEGDSPGTKLHIKVLSESKPHPLCLGMSLSYEQGRIISNSIVLQKMPSEKSLTPAVFTFRSPEFFEVNINIRRFLSNRNLNYAKIPQHIYSLESLEYFLNRYERDKRTAFFEFTKPQIFIATPTDSIRSESQKKKSNTISKIIKSLNKKLDAASLDVEIEFPGTDNEETATNFIEYHERTIYIFQDLKHVSVFFLIYDQRSVSRSLVELGHALAHVKAIVVFYKKGEDFPVSLDSLIKRKEFQYLKFIEYEGSLETNKEKITEDMYIETKTNLRDFEKSTRRQYI